MTQETSRIKIRELEPVDSDNIRSTDQLAIAVANPDRTLRASLSDVVNAGLSLQPGENITITKTGDTYTINAATQGFDASALEARIKALEDQITTLSQGSKVTATQTPPGGAKTGDLWWDTNTARMYIYFNSVWVQSNPTGDSPVTVQGGFVESSYDDSNLRDRVASLENNPSTGGDQIATSTGGGFIDMAILNTDGVVHPQTHQFDNYDASTQVVYYKARDFNGSLQYGILPESTESEAVTAATYQSGSTNARATYSKVWLNSTGLVSSADNHVLSLAGQRRTNIELHRWSRSSAS